MGLLDFSYHCMQEIIKQKGQIVGLLTKRNSNYNEDYKDLTPLAKKYNIPVHYIKNINSDRSYNKIKELKPDIIFCFGWSRLLKERILNLPPLGVIGVHPAKLPYNRGRHPLIWALVLGLKESALTFFRMDRGADTGDILSQKKFKIDYGDNAASLYKKIKNLASKQIKNFLPKLETGNINYKKQDLTKGNVWRKRGKIDGKIDWRMTSRAVYNLVRGLTHPYVGAHCLYKNKEIKIWKVKEVKGFPENLEPGKVLKSGKNTVIIKTYRNAVEILDHEFKEMPQKGEYLKW